MKRYNKYGLTQRETEILQYIIDFKIVNGFSPTIGEIANGCYTSRSFARSCVYNLVDKGFIKYDKERHRSIIVLHTLNKISS